MTINHIDQLTEWWEAAEESDDFYPGDTWIKRRQAQTGGYVYDVGRVTSKKRYYEARVLARAPKPKPAWHETDYVIASPRGGSMRIMMQVDTDRWSDGQEGFSPDDLTDVTPLIEAKVTDEMVERLEGHFIETSKIALPAGLARRMIAAALGLETE